jgi:hypothetical protein
MESTFAKEKAFSFATEEGAVVELELSHPRSIIAKKQVIMYKNLRMLNIFCNFAPH